MRVSREQMYMDVAEVIAKRSACLRNNVGCVVVDSNNHNIVAIGYNGPAAGIPQCKPEECHKGCSIAIHAEDNAIQRMPKLSLGTNIKKYSLYVTVSPCINCAKKIIERGDIKEVYYRYEYRDISGIIYLLSKGIRVYKILTGGIVDEQRI